MRTPESPTTFDWKGYPWRVRDWEGGPGSLPWRSNNVGVDADANLVLGITRQDGGWTAAEVDLDADLGYGEYQWDCATPLEFEPHVVAAGFLYRDDANEIDIESSHWGGLPTNGSYTIQPPPYVEGMNYDLFDVPMTAARTRSVIHHAPGRIWLKTVDLETGMTIRRFRYTGKSYPVEDLRFIFNLWLYEATEPTDGDPVEVVITDFRFAPISGSGTAVGARRHVGERP